MYFLFIFFYKSYGLVPEKPYPKPTNDCYLVTKYVIENPDEFGVDKTRVIIAGDSAGKINDYMYF